MRASAVSKLRLPLAALAFTSVAFSVSGQVMPQMEQDAVDLRGIPTDPSLFVERFGLSREDFIPQVPIDEEAIRSIDRHTRAIQERAQREFTERYVRDRLESLEAEVTDPVPDDAIDPSPYRVTVLVSMSLGEDRLRDYFAAYPHPPQAGEAPVRFVFRGIRDGETLAGAAVRMAELSGARFARSRDEAELGAPQSTDPLILMDPRLFGEAERLVVPAIIVERTPPPDAFDDRSWGGRSHQEAVNAAISGTIEGVRSSDQALEPLAVFYGLGITPEEAIRRVDQDGARGDQGVFGRIFEIEEEDLRVYARRKAEERLSQIDANPERIEREYWARLRGDIDMIGITPAQEESIEPLSFAQRLNRDITDVDGNVIARAGQIFDPTTLVPWDRRVFIFDPLNEREVEFIDAWDGYLGPGVVRNLYIVTRLPETGSKELLEALVERFDAPVFVLNAQVAQSFRVRHTLTVIEPDGVGGALRREIPFGVGATPFEPVAGGLR